MASRTKKLGVRAALLELISEPAVAAGFAGAAARYADHVEAGARLGKALALRSLWNCSLADVVRAGLPSQHPHASSGSHGNILNAERHLIPLLTRYARRLLEGEIATPAAVDVHDDDVPFSAADLESFAVRHNIERLLRVDLWELGIRGRRRTVLDAFRASVARAVSERTDAKDFRLVRGFIAHEARIKLPPMPRHERPPVMPVLAAFHAAVAARRDRLPAGRFSGDVRRVALDSHHKPPVIFVEHFHRQYGVEVAEARGADALRLFQTSEMSAEVWGAILDAALDLLAWPEGDEETALIRALTPPWMELVRALDHAKRASDGRELAAQREERFVFAVRRGHGIELVVQARAVPNKNGELPPDAVDGWHRGFPKGRHELPSWMSPDDLAIIARMLASLGYVQDIPHNLRLLAGHPRVVTEDGAPLHIEERLGRLVVSDRGIDTELVTICFGDEVCDGKTLGALLRDGGAIVEDREQGRLVVKTLPAELMPVVRALVDVGGAVPTEGREQLLRALAPLESSAPAVVEVDERLLGERVPPQDELVARLEPERLAGAVTALTLRLGVRALRLAAPFSPDGGPDRVAAFQDNRRTYCVRDRERERALCAGLALELPLSNAAVVGDAAWRLSEPDDAIDVVRALRNLTAQQRVVVEWPEGRAWKIADANVHALRLEVDGPSPLTLHVTGLVSVDGATVDFIRLLDAARGGSRYVALHDDTFVALSDELRERAAALADAGAASDAGMTGTAALAVALEEMAAAGATVEGSKLWTNWRERLAVAASVDERPPRALNAELRPYQREGVRFLRRLVALGSGGILADDMGLGKTLQAIALLVERAKKGSALVVAPTSVCFNWRRELERFAPSLRHVVLHDVDLNDRVRALQKLKKNDVLIASYGLVVREHDALKTREFATLIIDEAQAIKNAASQRAQAVRALRADVRIALSGTPIENHTGELWSIFAAVAPGLLPPFDEFRARFQIPIERGRSPERRRALARLVRPFLLRRTKAEVAPELPPRTEIVVRVELSSEERQHYDALRAVLAEKITATDAAPAQKRVIILAALQRLRQIACHPALDVTGGDSEGPSSKLKALMQLIVDLKENRHHALVFSQFTRLLDLVEPQLREAGVSFVRLDGSTDQRARSRAVDAFQAGDVDVFLLSLKAGGFGLNLTAADYVVHLDPWWNPAAEAQATDRAHRIGQTRPVTVYRLVASGTLEEGVIAMQERKRAIFSGVLDDATDTSSLHLDETELLSLLADAAGSRAA